MGWFNKKQQLNGVLLFRGTLPLKAEEFAFLAKSGIKVQLVPAPPAGARWQLALEHPKWGKARLSCLQKGLPPFPRDLIGFSDRLTPEEKDSMQIAQTGLYLAMESPSAHILRDRKNFLRLGSAICGTDGVAVVDLLANAIWTPPALQDELAHDADLDIQDIFALHAVTEQSDGSDDQRAYWAHTHGLQEIGRFDFDLIGPSNDALSQRTDFVRASAFMVLEEMAALDGDGVEIVRNGPKVSFVSAARFSPAATGKDVEKYRRDLDPYHTKGHGVMCEAGKPGFLSRLMGRGTIRPSRMVTQDFPDGMLINYSASAGALTADRAQKTLKVFAAWNEEFAEFSPTCIAKLRFDTSGGGSELPWFEVHGVKSEKIDATCINDPYHIEGLAKGDRAEHPAERLTDWIVMLPFANLTPRSMSAARIMRSKREQLREIMREAKAAGL
jgi:hypothetical protein